MTTLISFPFRLTPNGSVAAADDASVEYLQEELAQLIRTQPGERVLVPTYGMPDPAYAGFDDGTLVAQVGVFGPPITIRAVDIAWVSDTEQDVTVFFDETTNTTDADGEDF